MTTSLPQHLGIFVEMPAWIEKVMDSFPTSFDADENRMDLAIALSRYNLERGGAPFGAAVFSGARLVAVGVNRVRESGLSIAHAEIVALARAQLVLGRSDDPKGGPFSLVTSTEPCCQCLGALFFSGMRRLVCGAIRSDAEAVGFEEGPRSKMWTHLLRARGISVERHVRRPQARNVLVDYLRGGGNPESIRHPTIPFHRD